MQSGTYIGAHLRPHNKRDEGRSSVKKHHGVEARVSEKENKKAGYVAGGIKKERKKKNRLEMMKEGCGAPRTLKNQRFWYNCSPTRRLLCQTMRGNQSLSTE